LQGAAFVTKFQPHEHGDSLAEAAMSAAASLALEKAQRRATSRYPIHVPLDVIALRSGVPENLPGRCTDLSEGGVGGMVAGELSAGQQVAVELRLPGVGVPVRARAIVRYQGQLRSGFEFVGLPVEQREMIRYWAYRLNDPQFNREQKKEEPETVPAAISQLVVDRAAENSAAKSPVPRIRMHRSRFYYLLGAMLLLAVLAWWQWQRSWKELEVSAAAASKGADSPLQVAPETMEMRIVSKVDPVYPEEARRAGKQGLAVLDAVIGADGTVSSLKPVAGADDLVKSAEAAVRAWKFEPYQSSGRAVAVETTIAVEFRLN
jgi:TonB family protein